MSKLKSVDYYYTCADPAPADEVAGFDDAASPPSRSSISNKLFFYASFFSSFLSFVKLKDSKFDWVVGLLPEFWIAFGGYSSIFISPIGLF